MKDEAEIVRRLRGRAELHLRHARWPMELTYYSGDDAGMMVDAAAEIERLREQLAKRTDALKAAQSVLQVLVTPGNEKISSLHIWTQAVAAETGARIALTDDQGGREMTTVGEDLPKQMARVRDELIPQYQSIGPAGGFAIAMMRRSLDRAATAMTEGDLPAMIAAYQELKSYQS